MNLNQIESSQMSNKDGDSTPTAMNKTDVQWSDTSKIHSSM
eukprot:CAMPEP_0205807614 /NCGR_PEP_ID=MMETSP0205-20121125/11365_1 /ASSEMBLY_ACC=CAM_ASM_000278 /TAXON_ID=36767 /ORGANISM="Euplotes focardii, Strain TN1" /LENGTH=40 /DNA_ID= /DNA_START= /DNA_END= /DNA_ORIENTATION=